MTGDGNDVVLDTLRYQFFFNPKLRVTVSATGTKFGDIFATLNPEFSDNVVGSLSRFGQYNPLYRLGDGAGLGLNYDFSKSLNLSLAYFADDAGNPADKAGLFNGQFAALGQLTYQPNDRLGIGLAYSRYYAPGGQAQVSGGTGSVLANQPFAAAGLSLLPLQVALPHELAHLAVGTGMRYSEDVREFLHGRGNPRLFVKRRISFNVRRCGSVIPWTGRLPRSLISMFFLNPPFMAYSMVVPVVDIREMVMNMLQWSVIVPMIMIGYRLAHLVVLMLMMTIVGMLMLMLLCCVQMFVFVLFGQMQPDAQSHENSGNDQTCVDRFA